MEKKILVVDDEKNIVDMLRFNLEKEGFTTVSAYDGEQAINMALAHKPKLILLDLMLPKKDGFTVCRTLRQSMDTPILMLTAKEEEIDKVLGLELGADDYITKPFSPREVIARVKAHLRRTSGDEMVGTNNSAGSHKVYVFGDLEINIDKYEVKRNSEVIELTVKEFELLKFLAMQPDQIFTRENLLEHVWGYEYYGDARTVDVTVRRLREKIEPDASNPQYIMTKRGIGYYFGCK